MVTSNDWEVAYKPWHFKMVVEERDYLEIGSLEVE